MDRVVETSCGHEARATLELFDEAQAVMVDHLEVGRRVSGKVRIALQVPDADAMTTKLVAFGAWPIADALHAGEA